MERIPTEPEALPFGLPAHRSLWDRTKDLERPEAAEGLMSRISLYIPGLKRRGFTAKTAKIGHWKKEWKAHYGTAKSEEHSTPWQAVDGDS